MVGITTPILFDPENQSCKGVTVMENVFEEWAILEIMGYRRLAGKVTESVIGGGNFIRIDIPTEGDKFATQYYSPSSIYCITPTSEDIARSFAISNQPMPVNRWEFQITEGIKE